MPLFQTGRLAIGDHEDLFVGILPPAQDIHGQFQSGYRIGMIRSYLQVGKVFDLYRPGIIAEYNDIECIFRILGGDELAERHGYLLGTA